MYVIISFIDSFVASPRKKVLLPTESLRNPRPVMALSMGSLRLSLLNDVIVSGWGNNSLTSTDARSTERYCRLPAMGIISLRRRACTAAATATWNRSPAGDVIRDIELIDTCPMGHAISPWMLYCTNSREVACDLSVGIEVKTKDFSTALGVVATNAISQVVFVLNNKNDNLITEGLQRYMWGYYWYTTGLSLLL